MFSATALEYIVAQNDTCPYSDRMTEVYAVIDQCMSVLKTLKFSLVLRIHENSDVFNTLIEIYTSPMHDISSKRCFVENVVTSKIFTAKF